jgi:spermidine/putrescine transport system ATP-binding protein
MVLSGRIAVMSAGRIEQVGSPAEVYDHPATEFVASFLGVSNLIPGEVEERGAGLAKIRLQNGLWILVPNDRLRTDATQIKIGIRPEKLRVLTDDEVPDPAWNILEGAVELMTYMGVNHQYEVRSSTGQSLTFPLWVYGAVKTGTPPQVFVLSTFIFVGGLLLALLNSAIARRNARRGV